jgi:hypothetical protein
MSRLSGLGPSIERDDCSVQYSFGRPWVVEVRIRDREWSVELSVMDPTDKCDVPVVGSADGSETSRYERCGRGVKLPGTRVTYPERGS